MKTVIYKDTKGNNHTIHINRTSNPTCLRYLDYSAVTDNYDNAPDAEVQYHGRGGTPAHALDDLIEQIEADLPIFDDYVQAAHS